MYRVPGNTVGLQVQVQACIGDTDRVEQERTRMANRGQRSTPSMSLVLNLSISVSNVNLTVRVH